LAPDTQVRDQVLHSVSLSEPFYNQQQQELWALKPVEPRGSCSHKIVYSARWLASQVKQMH